MGILSLNLDSASAQEVLAWAVDQYGTRLAISTSFQAGGMVLNDMAARISPKVRVFTLDTGRLPPETHEMIETVRRRYGISVEVVSPDSAEVEAMVTRHGVNLFYRDVPSRLLCCQIRKVRPLDRKMREFDAWVTGLRRSQNEVRADVRKIDQTASPVKISPLADWTRDAVFQYIRENDVPLHPLYAQGYPSIGCAPCTRAVESGEPERAGRWWWEQDSQTECGIHFGANGRAERAVDVLLREVMGSASPQTAPAPALRHEGFTLWFTGMSGAGKSTISQAIETRLRACGAKVELLDGDVVRTHLSKGLGFSKEDRDTHIRRIGFVCEMLSRNGVIAIAAVISPYRAVRDEVRERIPNFVEVYVHCPLEVRVERDVKGLYKQALAGQIAQFTGVSDPYEPPVNPDIAIDSSTETAEVSVAKVWAKLEDLGLIGKVVAGPPQASSL